MFNALAARKDALIERLKEKTEELRKICIQEAVSISLSWSTLLRDTQAVR